MTEKSTDKETVILTDVDVVLARQLSLPALAELIARKRNLEQDLAETKAKLAEALADSIDKRTGLPLPGPATRRANEILSYVGGDRFIDPISAVCFITDIEHFKKINAVFDLEGGDAFIRAKADFLKAKVRDTDVLTRWGGDEFVILVPVFGNSSVEEVVRFYEEKLMDIPQSPDFPSRIRWGYSVFQEHDDLDSMLSRIDITTNEGKAAAKYSAVNELFSLT